MKNQLDCRNLTGIALVAAGMTFARVPAALAQEDSHVRRYVVFTGSAAENYLRTLSTLGLVSQNSWAVRPLEVFEVDGLSVRGSDGAWTGHSLLRATESRSRRFDFTPIEARAWYNSAFPFGINDGADWRGRGFGIAVDAGAAATIGPLSIRIAPTVFWSENRSFRLEDNGQTGRLAFGDRVVSALDSPQRFGDSPYARLDPGQSHLKLRAFGVSTGLTTENLWWGPMSEYPFILGNNAPGFLHAFVGTTRPWNIGIGELAGRLIYGRLEQSDYSAATEGKGLRFASGFAASLRPAGFGGLEVGAARFFHAIWPDSGLSREYFTHLFEGLIKNRIQSVFDPDQAGDPNQSRDNQLASVFARWPAGRGFEIYGEYGREDHNWDGRDLIVEPDHSATIGVGLRKSWTSSTALRSLVVESFNYEASALGRHRGEGGIYLHGNASQGHTNRGQFLGAAIGSQSGAGTIVRLEEFSGDGARAFAIARHVVAQSGLGSDVQYILTLERLVRRETLLSSVSVSVVYEMNRYWERDAFNVQLATGTRYLRAARGLN